MQNTIITENANELALVTMFQVEELEERLENKWEAEVESGTNQNGPYCKATLKCTF